MSRFLQVRMPDAPIPPAVGESCEDVVRRARPSEESQDGPDTPAPSEQRGGQPQPRVFPLVIGMMVRRQDED